MKVQFKTTVVLPWRKLSFFLIFILQLVACSLWGQVLQKKTLTKDDYPKWGRLSLEKLTPNGQWISYTISYKNDVDTLFIKNTKSLKTHAFPSGNAGDFITPDWFTYQTTKGLHLVSLNNGKEEIIANVIQYVYSPIAKRLLILISEKKKENILIIRELNEGKQEHIVGVNEFLMDPTNQMILYTITTGNQHTINLLQLSLKNKKTVLLSGPSSFNNLVWHIKGKAVAFMQKSLGTSNNTIFYYNLSNKKLYYPNQKKQLSFLEDSLFIATTTYNLKISDDMQRVFFAVQRKSKSKDTLKDSDVQLWYGNAKWVYPMEEKRKLTEGTYLALWNPQQDRFRLISNDTLPQFMLNGDQKYAILYNTQQYEPQYAYEGLRDFYLVDLTTGKNTLILKKHSGHKKHTIPSPTGKYIAYFREKNWWIYDIGKETHTNITKNIGHSFFQNEKEHPGHASTYSNLGWTPEDKEILLCDEYDIWAITSDGLTARRLTHGREDQIQFRLAGYTKIILGKPNYSGWILNTIDFNQGLILEATQKNRPYGYYRWSPGSNEKLVSSTNTHLDQLIRTTSGDAFVYREQRYDLSPRLMLQTHPHKATRVLVTSNLQQQIFHWGKTKLIQYKNAREKLLQGILYYPADYNNKKKYPMIVHIYERLSQDLNKYINPSQFNDVGFNISTWTTQGYFVLAPDISYEIGKPGISATDCVVSATNEVIARGLVLPNKIGLIGHSFGGYETDFIITQTNLFAAAVAGAAVTDLTSTYLTIGGDSGRPDMWRFENQQWRMGKSLFEDQAAYDRNSPILHAKNITTPLLSWTGGNDKQVNWNQSIEFYLALRRLEKKHIMLLYPKEGHNLTNKKNQKDLFIRIQQWFNYHLKDSLPAPWIKAGLK
ncbi:prolyl oligopeptidase family serine peptidase [Flavobacterium sp. EDS]|uniref:S9 family peptidase n=1 Tax=Flavobacterium sp. EDS TaxID=2897328 RepID=UPI001E33FC52|nr:prolyl oligopeptidase family serine peptidase [Flavobacterium sp. EDS]MCD0474050.1 prolyl oligopeptidase family serine peptidase [Flavobacterium sp. EDS]